MTTTEALWKHLELNHTDSAAKLALADLLIENGDEITAYALKWCEKWGYWPAKGKQIECFYWANAYWGSYERNSRLPKFIYNELPGPNFNSLIAAVVELGVVLAIIRQAVALDLEPAWANN